MKLLLPIALLLLGLVQWENACVSGSDSESVQCREQERLALLHINSSMTIPIHSLEGQWEGKECCRWERVTCHPITGHVTQLDLGISHDDDWFDYHHGGILLNASMFLPLRHLRNLSLSVHGIYNCTDGAGFETWSNLTKSEILDLSDNSLDGSIIYDLARVPSLRTLDLSYNYINSSNLPINGFESWSNLTKLQMLDLSSNDIPTNFISTLAKVSSLRALYLDYSYVEDSINVKELTKLNLEVVSLRGCLDSGSSLDLEHWPSLKALSLAHNYLNDTLTLEGLCRLKNLEELDLSYNNFIGNLPPCLENFSSLKLVDLSNNQFQIKFPSSIFERLMFLRYLYLSNNHIEGTLSMRSFFNHSNLEVLGLSTTALNFRVKVVNLPFQLQVLELANCNILDVEHTFLYSQYKLQALDLANTGSKGPLSPMLLLLENNPNLIKLDLHKNFFTGPLQLPFLTHEKLSILDISDNHLGGELPVNISTKLPNLMYLNLSKNYFQGLLPVMPTSNLYTLDLSFNSLTDDIQRNFPMIHSNYFDTLDLSFNKLYGSFTSSFIFTPAKKLLLNDNNISGEITFSICNTSFRVLDLSNNKLNGVLPDCIGRADLSALKLSGNHLEGSLPLEICDIPNRWFLDLSDNKLSGSIPPCSNHSDLQIVNLSQNNLTGNFPITWLNISYIRTIDIGENYLSGELPIWIGMESNLSMLLARENMFGGSIPEQICQFKYLRILDLSYNNLSGQISSCIIDMGSTYHDLRFSGVIDEYGVLVEKLNFSNANFLLHIASYADYSGDENLNFGLKLMSKERLIFYCKKNLAIVYVIDFSSNKLVGNIPVNIGQMNWMIELNLSNNHLSGAITNSISNLHQLESLDLSHNSLTGEIPRDLTKLTSLEFFSVAYNDLSGPTLGVEAQFSTFGNGSYEGNPNLCGPPLSKNCVSTIGTTQPYPNKMSEDRILVHKGLKIVSLLLVQHSLTLNTRIHTFFKCPKMTFFKCPKMTFFKGLPLEKKSKNDNFQELPLKKLPLLIPSLIENSQYFQEGYWKYYFLVFSKGLLLEKRLLEILSNLANVYIISKGSINGAHLSFSKGIK